MRISLVLAITLASLTLSCGSALESAEAAAATCPGIPDRCGPTEKYGPKCATWSQYAAAGWDVSEACKTCQLARVGGIPACQPRPGRSASSPPYTYPDRE